MCLFGVELTVLLFKVISYNIGIQFIGRRGIGHVLPVKEDVAFHLLVAGELFHIFSWKQRRHNFLFHIVKVTEAVRGTGLLRYLVAPAAMAFSRSWRKVPPQFLLR